MEQSSYFLHHFVGILFVILLGSYIAIHLTMLIALGIQALFLKPFKYKFREFVIFGYKFYKNPEGKWERNGRSHNGLTMGDPVFDMENATEEEVRDLEKRSYIYMFITRGLCLAIDIAVFIGSIILRNLITLDVLRAFILTIGITFLIRGIIGIIITIYSISRANSNTLSGYTTRALNQYRAGVPLQSMDLKPVKELGFTNVKNLDRLLYFPVYFNYCDITERFEELSEAVGDIEKIKRPDTETNIDRINNIYLTYYYSCHNIDPAKAQMYFDRAGKQLAMDKDANGMRIKGFYYLNAMNDIEKARECLSSAESSIDTYSIPVERENERILIARLRNAIESYNG